MVYGRLPLVAPLTSNLAGQFHPRALRRFAAELDQLECGRHQLIHPCQEGRVGAAGEAERSPLVLLADLLEGVVYHS